MKRIYLDHAATTQLSASAREAMLPFLDAGNASSLHADGRQAREAVDVAREIVSSALGALFAEIIFTSGGTEAANLAILGYALANEDPRRNRVILGSAEHHCVLHTQALLERLGYRVSFARVDREARIDPNFLTEEVSDDVLLVSTMHANNEFGTINPISEIAGIAHAAGAKLHVDAVQSFLKPELSFWHVDDLAADLVTVSSHKVNGPKAVGVVYSRAGTKLKPLVGGGGQEREVRGGTENVAGIVGFGAAVRQHVEHPVEIDLRDRFEHRILDLGAVPSVSKAPRLKGHVHVRFPGVKAESLLIALDRLGISASSGAACSSGSIEPSHVMLAAGYSLAEAREGVRFTLGPETSADELDQAAERIEFALSRMGDRAGTL